MFQKFYRKDDFEAVRHSRQVLERLALEEHIANSARDGHPFSLPGFCRIDGCAVDFQVDPKLAQLPGVDWEVDPPRPNWRETLQCPRCLLNNRQRGVVDALLQAAASVRVDGRVPSVYMMEQLSPTHAWFSEREEFSVVGSEFLGMDAAPGEVRNGVRHEDAEHLSFPDASFDFVLSCDVLEHVNEPTQSAVEIARVLRPGGELFLSVPLRLDRKESIRRAHLVDGRPEHLLEPFYHGNPMLPEEGSLVFTDFGWDFLAALSGAGLQDCAIWIYWSLEHGHLGGNQQFFVHARR